MRILVYPHSMELGGSQLNAIELAAASRDRGHDVLVYSEPGPLTERVGELKLEHIPRHPSRLRPGASTALDLARLARTRRIDVIHGWEWPPILEGFAAANHSRRTVAVGSIMSMSIAPFIPSGMSLTVGTERIQEACRPARRGPTVLLEPPVDTEANRPKHFGDDARPRLDGVPESGLRILIVSRLAAELKLEGILTAVSAIGELAGRRDVQLVVVGDGPGRMEVERAAAAANVMAGRTAVILTGELTDPRPAYASADVCVGMGGSALRSLAFGKPLVVQGEGGFFETLTPANVHHFLVNGWYGIADRSSSDARAHLLAQLEPLLVDAACRRNLGAHGRRLVEDRFSLQGAAARLDEIYGLALSAPVSWSKLAQDASRSARQLLDYKIQRRQERRRGVARVDDFNSRPV